MDRIPNDRGRGLKPISVYLLNFHSLSLSINPDSVLSEVILSYTYFFLFKFHILPRISYPLYFPETLFTILSLFLYFSFFFFLPSIPTTLLSFFLHHSSYSPTLSAPPLSSYSLSSSFSPSLPLLLPHPSLRSQ